MSDSATPWTVAYQAPRSMGFSRKGTGGGCHFLLQGSLQTQPAQRQSREATAPGRDDPRVAAAEDAAERTPREKAQQGLTSPDG